jgi:hypothetical protein
MHNKGGKRLKNFSLLMQLSLMLTSLPSHFVFLLIQKISLSNKGKEREGENKLKAKKNLLLRVTFSNNFSYLHHKSFIILLCYMYT